MTSTRHDKAWKWTESLLRAAYPEAVSPDLLEAVLTEVGYRDPYELINNWTREGRLKVVTGSPGDRDYRARRYIRGRSSPMRRPMPSSPPPISAATRELIPTRMGKLIEGDWLVRDDAIGTVRVVGLVKSGTRPPLVLRYVRQDGSTGEYPTWAATHARILAAPRVDEPGN